MNPLQKILRCIWEIEMCRTWGRNEPGFWPIQTEMDWAEELKEIYDGYRHRRIKTES